MMKFSIYLYIVVAFLSNQHLFSSTTESYTWKTAWYTWLVQEECILWHAISAICGLSKEMCLAQAPYTSDDCSQAVLVSTHNALQAVFNKVITHFNVRRPIALYGTDSIGSDCAQAYNNAIQINNAVFNNYPKQAQMFVIAHELQHCLHYDAGTIAILDKYELPNNVINKFKRFLELRADIVSALHSTVYAQGFIQAVHVVHKNATSQISDVNHLALDIRLALAYHINACHSSNSQALALPLNALISNY